LALFRKAVAMPVHRPTAAFALLTASSLLIPVIQESPTSVSAFLHLVACHATCLVPSSVDQVSAWMPMVMLSLLALSHSIPHDLLGYPRSDGYRAWTAFCRYCESRVLLNLMAAASAYASLSSTESTGFHLPASNLLSVALVVQHYFLSHPRILARGYYHAMLTVMVWVNVASEIYRMSVATKEDPSQVLQALFLTQAVWHGYIPSHFANSFTHWLSMSSSPQAQTHEALEAAYTELDKQEQLAMTQV